MGGVCVCHQSKNLLFVEIRIERENARNKIKTGQTMV